MTRSRLFIVALVLGAGFVPWTTRGSGVFSSSSFAADTVETDESEAAAEVSEEEKVQPGDAAADEQSEVEQDEADEAEGE
jgi:hypothetical protein